MNIVTSRCTVILVISICSLFLFIKYIAQLFPSLIGISLIHDFALSGLQLGILASSYYYSYSIMQIVSGWILDRFSLRFAAALSISIMGLGLLLFSHTHSFFMMCLFRVLMGVGASFATVLYMKSAALLTSHRTFGMVSSFLATATMLGAAAGGAPLAYLFHWLSWERGLEYVGILTIFLGIVGVILFPGKLSNSSKENTLSSSGRRLSSKSVFFHPQNWLLLAYSGLAFTPVVIIGGVWGTPFLVLKYHLSIQSVSYLLSIMFIGLAVGAPCWAYLSLKTQVRKSIMQIANLLALLCLTLIIYAPVSYSSSMALFFLLGFSVGCFMLSFQICREINPIGLLGLSFAFMNTGEGLVGSVIEPLVGKILDLLKSTSHHAFTLHNFYWALSLVLGCFVFASLFLIKLQTEPQEKIHFNKAQ